MTITIELSPEVERELAAQAAAKGMDVSAYAAAVLRETLKPVEQRERKQTLSEFFMESPLAGSGIILERDKDPGRDIEL